MINEVVKNLKDYLPQLIRRIMNILHTRKSLNVLFVLNKLESQLKEGVGELLTKEKFTSMIISLTLRHQIVYIVQ